MWWLDSDPHGHPESAAQGHAGQLIAVVPEHQAVVAVGSVPTDETGDVSGSVMWSLVHDVIVSALT
jgi:hypothetical protein